MSAYNAIMNLLPLLSREEKLMFVKELNILPISEHSLIEKEKELEHSKDDMYKKYNTLKQELQNESHLIKQQSIELIKKKYEQEEENKYQLKMRNSLEQLNYNLDITKKALEDYKIELDYEKEQLNKEKVNFQNLEEIYEKDRKETKELYHRLMNTDILTPQDISNFWMRMNDILNHLIKFKINKVSITYNNYKYFLTIDTENDTIKMELPNLFKIK
jgi:DNA repair exonuclease SbcCD ATPase subunit